LAQPLWDVRLRSAGRNQLFDLPFRLATSLAHDSLVVLLRQVMCQQEQARKMDGSRAELVEHLRQPARETRHPHALASFVLAVTQTLATVRRKRPACLIEEQPAPIDFHQMFNDFRHADAFSQHESGHESQQQLV
jgi:hypothetical protein